MDLGLQGKTVLVTGASKGIGKATAFSFAAEGAGHIHINSRSLESLEAVKKELQARHNTAVTCHAIDISQRGGCEKLAEAVGEVDILVNNAGAIPRGSIDMIDEDTWRAAWDLKVFGFVNLTRIYLAKMKARKSGIHGSVSERVTGQDRRPAHSGPSERMRYRLRPQAPPAT